MTTEGSQGNFSEPLIYESLNETSLSGEARDLVQETVQWVSLMIPGHTTTEGSPDNLFRLLLNKSPNEMSLFGEAGQFIRVTAQ